MRQLNFQEAVNALRDGDLLLYPTETFFGLGCKISDDAAVARVFQVKRRLFAMPLPVILADIEQLAQVAQMPPAIARDAERLAALFWPGPLSLILPARMHLSPLLTGGTGHIAVRVSPHPVPGKLAAALGEPVVSSSANISGRPAATRPEDIDPELTRAVPLLNMPPVPAGGEPSTLAEPLGGSVVRIHRAGAVAASALQQAGFVLREDV